MGAALAAVFAIVLRVIPWLILTAQIRSIFRFFGEPEKIPVTRLSSVGKVNERDIVSTARQVVYSIGSGISTIFGWMFGVFANHEFLQNIALLSKTIGGSIPTDTFMGIAGAVVALIVYQIFVALAELARRYHVNYAEQRPPLNISPEQVDEVDEGA